jgi:parallel beta-helix repeat protein
VIRRQGGQRPAGVNVRGGEDVVVRDCEVTLVNGGSGITAYQVDNILVDNCFVHHCPGHTKGVLLRNCANVVTRNCRLVKNTSTALDYYGCINGSVLGTRVTDHCGMHANGLTFYLGCKNLLVEGNEVYDSNIGLTIQDAEDVIIRNNIIDSSGRSLCVGIWTATPLRNVQFLNNLLLRASTEETWHAAMFSNSRGPEGLVVKNNVIDGLSGNLPGEFSHNIYTRWGPNQENRSLGAGEIYEPDLKKIFVDPENRDFRLRAGSPAIDAGAAVKGESDFDGRRRPVGDAIDIGPHEYGGT